MTYPAMPNPEKPTDAGSPAPAYPAGGGAVIRTDHASVAGVAAAMRGTATMINTAEDTAAVTVSAAAAEPVPAGARPSPAMAALAETMPQLAAATAAISAEVSTLATAVTAWEGGLATIQAGGAAGVNAVDGGGGGSW